MTNRKIKVALRLLEILMQCIFFVTLNIIFSFLMLKYNASQYSRCLMISVLVIAAYLFRKYINSFFTFYFCHFLLFVVAIFYARSADECFIYIIQVGILFAYSSNIKIKTTSLSEEKIPIIGMVIMVICYVTGVYTKNTVMIQSGLLLLVLFILIEIIYNNLDKINNVFIENKESVDFPATQLFRVNMNMLIASLIVVFVGMMAFYSGPYGNVFQIIGNFFLRIIGLILKWLLYRKPQVYENIETTSASDSFNTEESETGNYMANNPGSFDQLFYALLIMLAIFFTIVLIIKIARDINKFAKKKKLGADIIEFIKPQKKEKNRIKISRGNILREESEIDHNLKLRKIYKKKVKKGIGNEKIASNEFPEDITRKGISEDPKEVKIVTDIYEKARYSKEKINSEEMDIIKNIKKL